MSGSTATFEGWAILELMGHRRLAGYLSEATIAGASFVRIDVPVSGQVQTVDAKATQFYSPQAVYAITPTTEVIARRVAAANQPEPVHTWELPPRESDGDDEDEADVLTEDEPDVSDADVLTDDLRVRR